MRRPPKVDVTVLISLRKLRDVLDRMVFKLELCLAGNMEESLRKIILESLTDLDELSRLNFLISIDLHDFFTPELLVHVEPSVQSINLRVELCHIFIYISQQESSKVLARASVLR